MKITLKIAQAELRYLFYSPIAWVIMTCYFVLGSMKFLSPLVNFSRQQAVEVANNPNWVGFRKSLTLSLFTNALEVMSDHLYLFIPLLTMGVIGREVSNGSMALLRSSPIRTREVVMGKFLGLTWFNLILTAALALMLITGFLCVENAEFSLIFSILLGFFLLTSAYIAIGLFVSCLTDYQILAGIGTFMLFIILEKAGSAFQQYDFIRDITWFLSIDGRIKFLKAGLISTRDVSYFILIIILFLGLSMIKLQSLVASMKKSTVFLRYLVLTSVILLLGYFSSRPGAVGYLDITRDQRNTLDSATQAVIKELDGSSINVTLFTNVLQPTVSFAMPAKRNEYLWDFWERYLRFYPNINFNYRFYYNITPQDSALLSMFYGKRTRQQVAAVMTKMHKFDFDKVESPQQIDSSINLADELYRVVMQLEYKGKKVFLRTYPSKNPWPFEYNVSGAIKELVSTRSPMVSFSTGHYERSPMMFTGREHGGNTNERSERHTLINLGVHTDTISLENTINPDSTNVLVIADPRSPYSLQEQENIMSYLNNGGNAIIYGEPAKQSIINGIINQLGVHMEEGVMVLPRQHVETEMFSAAMTKAGNWMAKEPVMQLHQRTGRRTAMANFYGTGILSFMEKNGFTVEPIISIPGNTMHNENVKQARQDTVATGLVVDAGELKKDSYADEKSTTWKPGAKKKQPKKAGNEKNVGYDDIWMERGVFVRDSAAPTYSPDEGDYRKDEYILAVKLHRKINNKEQRIVIAADADFMSVGTGSGGSIALGLYSWLLENKYPVYTKYKLPEDIRLKVGKKGGITLYNVYVYVLPSILLLIGSIILIRRFRK
ncbi:MAG: Gldg family protein [Pseudobacter sp.]|uniref:Gldg family protein n=1 Tax=Pseudobacter sp. TaxID=2045420 RepID=UPI003F7D4974